jgi:hypothetical protein
MPSFAPGGRRPRGDVEAVSRRGTPPAGRPGAGERAAAAPSGKTPSEEQRPPNGRGSEGPDGAAGHGGGGREERPATEGLGWPAKAEESAAVGSAQGRQGARLEANGTGREW